MNSTLRDLDLRPDHCVAVGDVANDIPLMEVAGLSIAFNAKRCVREHADVVMTGDGLRETLPHIISFKETINNGVNRSVSTDHID